MIDIEVAFATADEQKVIFIQLAKDSTVQQAIEISKIVNYYPEINLNTMRLGIFGKVCSLEKIVEQGDRIEIYRPLLQNPMDARRNRVVKNPNN